MHRSLQRSPLSSARPHCGRVCSPRKPRSPTPPRSPRPAPPPRAATYDPATHTATVHAKDFAFAAPDSDSGRLDDVPSRERRHHVCTTCRSFASTAARRWPTSPRALKKPDARRRSGSSKSAARTRRTRAGVERHGEPAAGQLRHAVLRRHAGPRAARRQGHGSSASRSSRRQRRWAPSRRPT